MQFASIALPVPLGKAFSYLVPTELEARVVRGARVLCELGARKVLGVVLSVSEDAPPIPLAKLKPLVAVVESEPVLPAELVDFLTQLADYYLAPIGEVMRLALPAVQRADLEPLKERGLLGRGKWGGIGRLSQVVERIGASELDPEATLGSAGLRGQAKEILERLQAEPEIRLGELELSFGNARAAVRRLAALGLVRVSRKEVSGDPFEDHSTPSEPPPEPTLAQATAISELTSALHERSRKSFLLQGVTGSGKTEIYLRAAASCLELGRAAIILVPEIALTPQLVTRFRARLGNRIAVLHSGLSARERRVAWGQLRSGALKVAIGARSALFAPLENLALICVDEEHDPSFKQDEGVHYSARDMALFRAYRAGAVCVLGSATPSLASEALVRAGKLRRLSLPERATAQSALPKVQLVDLRRFGPGPSGEKLLTLPLHRALGRVIDAKEQAILFLNRRGFAPSLICEECGSIAQCPNCAVALTLHRDQGERLLCHYCDYQCRLLTRCAACQSTRLSQEGIGTEGIQAALKKSFPSARVARLDRDVAAGLKSEAVLERMRNREIDVLVGTQMVTKGHDLPGVTLVGVLNADAALAFPDFQASERTFQLLVQVAGRAGRGMNPGVVLIQTRNPEHPAILHAVDHDVASFVEQELAERLELRNPPYARLALVRVDAVERGLAEARALVLSELARRASPRAEIVGPSTAPLARLRNRYRYRFLVKARERSAVRQALLAVLRHPGDRRVRVTIDIDPLHML